MLPLLSEFRFTNVDRQDGRFTNDVLFRTVREERLRLNMVQPEFAELGGVGKQSQINYESGKRAPDASYLAALRNTASMSAISLRASDSRHPSTAACSAFRCRTSSRCAIGRSTKMRRSNRLWNMCLPQRMAVQTHLVARGMLSVRAIR